MSTLFVVWGDSQHLLRNLIYINEMWDLFRVLLEIALVSNFKALTPWKGFLTNYLARQSHVSFFFFFKLRPQLFWPLVNWSHTGPSLLTKLITCSQFWPFQQSSQSTRDSDRKALIQFSRPWLKPYWRQGRSDDSGFHLCEHPWTLTVFPVVSVFRC